MDKVIAVIVGIFLITITVIVTSLLAALPVYFLWNWLMPEIFGLTTVTFWQAFGLAALASCFFNRGSGSSSSD